MEALISLVFIVYFFGDPKPHVEVLYGAPNMAECQKTGSQAVTAALADPKVKDAQYVCTVSHEKT